MAFIRGDTNAVLKDLTVLAERTVEAPIRDVSKIIASNRPEDGSYTKIPISTNVAFPVKFEGERKIKGKDVTVIQQYNQETYELTIGIDAELAQESKAYELNDLVEEAATAARMFRSYTLSQLVIGGATAKAYDGNNFYNATHKYAKATKSSNINNTVAATGTSVPQLYTDFSTAMKSMRTFLDNEGRLINPNLEMEPGGIVVHCPQALNIPFLQLFNGTMVPITVPVTTSGTAAAPVAMNVLQSAADVLADGYLDANSSTAWYLHYVKRLQKPFAVFERYPLQVHVLGFDTEHCIKTNQVLICIKERFAVGNYRFDRSIKVS